MRSPSDGELLSFHYVLLHIYCKPDCIVPGAQVSLLVDDQPLAEFSCDDGHTHSAAIRTTRQKWAGKFTATLWTHDGYGNYLDEPYTVHFLVFFPPMWSLSSEDTMADIPMRVTPWLAEFSNVFGYHDYTIRTPSGVQDPSTLVYRGTNSSQWVLMERVAFDDGRFLVIDPDSRLTIPEPWHPTMGTAKEWGPRRGIQIARRPQIDFRPCDRTMHKHAFFFGFPQLDNHFEVLNAGFLALYATILEASGEIDPNNTVLITNVGAPVESGLGRYYRLFRTLSIHPIISLSEVRSHGVLCFDHVAVGLSGSYDLTSDSVDISHKELPEMNQYVTQALGIDATVMSHNPPTLLWISRKQDGNRNVENEQEILQAAREVGFAASAVDFEVMGMEEQVRVMQNVSVLMGIYGAGLTNAMFMQKGGVVVQILPFGHKNHLGEEFKNVAVNGPGHYVEIVLPESATGRWPWAAPPSVYEDGDGLWNWHAPGHGPGQGEEGEDDDGHGEGHDHSHGHGHRNGDTERHEDFSGTHGHATASIFYPGAKDITVDPALVRAALRESLQKLAIQPSASWLPNAPHMGVQHLTRHH
eukprot:CAMPEP_0114544750 /NCGR_PEP_ID=MMETSP0114-20121206/3039_1 /TAXON_ID=31324 /ORGANISM="Goniomonas sp, Strain m" /LENGTH=582 /DNA_ID=CAMNT_0001729143 /DNA_START=74 /DNA_END=1822 /DNA_ORIENTATION=-